MSLETSPNAAHLLVNTLGADVATLAYAAAPPTSGQISAPVIVDEHEPLSPAPGGIAFLVGVLPDQPVAGELIRRAGECEFSAVVLKRRNRELGPALAAARAAGVSLIVAVDEIPWRHLEALITTMSTSTTDVLAASQRTPVDQLFSIANAVAAVVGGSVAIEDMGWRVLAYSNIPGQRIDQLRRRGILDRRVPRVPRDEADYQDVMSDRGILRFPQEGDTLPRAAIAIRAGSLPLGTLWAIEGEDGLTERGSAAIFEGATLAAVQLLKAYSTPDLDRMRRADRLRDLLTNSAPSDSDWSQITLRPGSEVTLLAVCPSAPISDAESPVVTPVSREVDRLCASLRPDAPVTSIGATAYVLVSGNGAGGRLAQQLVTEVSRVLGSRVCAAVSTPSSVPSSLPKLRAEVEQVLRVTTSEPSAPSVATIEDVQGAIMLLQVSDTLDRHPEVRHPALQRLLELDRERNTELAPSLLAWLEAGQGVQAAAARLHVHPNTLRYRLERVRQLVTIDLDDPDKRLATWLELRLLSKS